MLRVGIFIDYLYIWFSMNKINMLFLFVITITQGFLFGAHSGKENSMGFRQDQELHSPMPSDDQDVSDEQLEQLYKAIHDNDPNIYIDNIDPLVIGDFYLPDFGCTPFGYAARVGRLDIVEYFLKIAPNLLLYPVCPDKSTALALVAEAGKLDMVKFFVAKAASNPKMVLDTQDTHGATPLHLAVVTGNYAIAHHLLLQGASPDIPDVYGRTPASLAISYQTTYPEMYALFKK